MITPVQRLPRYALLLKELQKNTPAKHSDYSQLTKAIKVIEKILDAINNKKKGINSDFLLLFSLVTKKQSLRMPKRL